MDERKASRGWAAWLLVLSAALPTAAVARMGWLAMSGAWDAVLTQNPTTTGKALLSDRWAIFWWSNPAITTLLLMGSLPLLALAGAIISGRSSAISLRGAARSAATVTGTFSTLLGTVGLVGFAGQFGGLLSVHTWGSAIPSQMDAFAPFIAATFTYTILCFTGTALLWSKKDEQLPDRLTVDSTVVATDARTEGKEGPASPEPAGEGQADLHSPQLDTPPNFPTPLATDLDLYRR